ncbi:hypothetical protein BCR33DRAFT_724070 [Rhizoclosmatium globosum]|uniref:HAD-like protein n=1 Tax=Rhizoclosmatium globosum TaxID=329046 RepID=A0A1Y2B9D5_9FUNG|nr:hypothetical protein BCR33DRAFT_724070 [Rhizoclosmatium globosum]|eukprot:ORY31120.1 hypothetical protein BCR33DRAFT_724070 [Rhizoclosmatium globosum]
MTPPPTHRYSVLCLDIDGTLLSSCKQVSARTLAAIERVRGTGASVALVTGRPALRVAPVSALLGFEPLVVCCNGAVAIAETGDVIFERRIERDDVTRIVATAAKFNMIVNYYQHGYHAVRVSEQDSLDNQARLDAFKDAVNIPFEYTHDYSAIPVLPAKILLLTVAPGSGYQSLKQNVPGINVYYEDSFLDCVHASVNKAEGVKQLCKHLGALPKETVCFGDGSNDIDFLQEAGLGFAMNNGVDAVKQVAHQITRFSNDEDGVAIEIEDLLEKGLFGPPIGI